MRKAIIALILVGLLSLATVATVFAEHDGTGGASVASDGNVSGNANDAGITNGGDGNTMADGHPQGR